MGTEPFKPQDIDQFIIETVRKEKPRNVEQLVKLIEAECVISEKEILEHIVRLRNRHKLVLEAYQSPSPRLFKSYILSRESNWYWTIITLSLVTTALVFTVPENAYPITYVRYVFGSIFILFLPGYSLIKALFPNKEFDNIERFSVSVGISLALVPIDGLLLNYTPWGIRTTPLTISLLALTMASATTAIIREHQNRSRK